jgi:hypothetical protein
LNYSSAQLERFPALNGRGCGSGIQIAGTLFQSCGMPALARLPWHWRAALKKGDPYFATISV